MKLKSFSKINLSLRVKKKTSKSLHNIESFSVLINLFDEINFKKNNTKIDKVIFSGKFKNNISKKNNTVLDTLALLRKLGFVNSFYKVTVKKNIPVFSGLGGGTGNSAALIKYFIKKKLTNGIICKLEKKIGTDLRIFLNSQSFQKNLRQVFFRKEKIRLNFLLVYPYISCSTKDIYSKVRNYNLGSKINFHLIKNKKVLLTKITSEKNDLQKIVEKKFLKIKKLIDFLSVQEKCVLSRLTGSGSACYGVFKSEKSAKVALIKVKKRFPRYWCVTTKTI